MGDSSWRTRPATRLRALALRFVVRENHIERLGLGGIAPQGFALQPVDTRRLLASRPHAPLPCDEGAELEMSQSNLKLTTSDCKSPREDRAGNVTASTRLCPMVALPIRPPVGCRHRHRPGKPASCAQATANSPGRESGEGGPTSVVESPKGRHNRLAPAVTCSRRLAADRAHRRPRGSPTAGADLWHTTLHGPFQRFCDTEEARLFRKAGLLVA